MAGDEVILPLVEEQRFFNLIPLSRMGRPGVE
jgi:hypothetical protein